MKFLSCLLSGFFAFTALFSSAQNNSLLYKIESPDSKTSYLFGTMHVVPDSAFYFPSKAQKILKHTDQLVLEVTSKDMLKSKSLIYLDEGSAFDIFTSEQKDSVLAWGAETLKTSQAAFESAFRNLKPFNLLQVEFIPMMSGNVKFVEQELEKIAANIPQAGLETTEQQLAVFDSIPDAEMADMILDMFRDPSKSDQTMKELVTAYQSRDIDQISKVAEAQETSPEISNLLLYNRNARWIPKIQEFTQTKSCFIAVGAAHLGGEKGVLNLLKKAGYTVTPIEY